MCNISVTGGHDVYFDILRSRGLKGLPEDYPFWKLNLTDNEYKNLKQILISHPHDLSKYGEEAALCYAEWWKRDYKGGVPSKEDVAIGVGLSRDYGDNLYFAARNGLKKHNYTFIHSLRGTEYFRTLLTQGGLPVNFIVTNRNLDSFSRFLKGLIRELSIINYDWGSNDHSVIQQFNCIRYLGNAFKNENIYDVAMQIVHAIIKGDDALLPYDGSNATLDELTRSLKTEYTRVQQERRVRPLSLHWKLHISDNDTGYLFVNMDVVKDIVSDSIPGLNKDTCYAFDVFVAGTLVGKYVRKHFIRDREGRVKAIYTRISIGVNNDILWKGEPVVEVKVRCDNDDRIFLTIPGCYPPNFEDPQVFQMLNDKVYIQKDTANTENNIAVFSSQWQCEGSHILKIGDMELRYAEFVNELCLKKEDTDEEIKLTNEFTPYSAEFSDNYILWVESSNYKLLSKVPIIRVYDEDKNWVQKFSQEYRVRKGGNNQWCKLYQGCSLPIGLIDIRVTYPDGHHIIETFYSIGNMSFESSDEHASSTEIACRCHPELCPEIENNPNLDIERIAKNTWKISRQQSSTNCPPTCDFRIYKSGNPTLCISVAIPFDGVMITDVKGNLIPSGTTISFDNLTYYHLTSHGRRSGRTIDVSYNSHREEQTKHLKRTIIDGMVSLADYRDFIMRMFHLYGANSFDRSSSVVMNICGTRIYIREFVFDTYIESGKIVVDNNTDYHNKNFTYEDNLYAFPVDEYTYAEEMTTIKLIREDESQNVFYFPKDFTDKYKEVIVFSGREAKHRIIPKYYHLDEEDLNVLTRTSHSRNITEDWIEKLQDSDILTNRFWKKACKAFDICSYNNLPFSTHNSLKAIVGSPKLIAKFIIAMWANDLKDVLEQDIDRFEQEMAIALHWISASVWAESINEFIESIEDNNIKTLMLQEINDFYNLLSELFKYTISTDNSTDTVDIVSDFTSYIKSKRIAGGRKLFISDISNYQMRIRGVSDINDDLPTIQFRLMGRYYPPTQMLPFYQTMIESAMCAAENTCNVNGCINLFSQKGKEYARIINFYRKYFKETFCEIFMRTVKYIANPQRI